MIHITGFLKGGGHGGGGVLEERATIVRGYFAKILLLFASKFGKKPGSMSELVVLKVHGRHFLKLPNRHGVKRYTLRLSNGLKDTIMSPVRKEA